jgi:hypothetical protein
MRAMRRLTFGLAIGALSLPANSAGQDSFVVRGRVVERSDETPIRGAAVEMPGRTRVLTDEAGTFRFDNVSRGRYTLSVDALGYNTVSVDLAVLGDTTLTIEMDVQPVVLDSVEARVRYVTFRGQVLVDSSGEPVYDADVHLGLDRRTTTNPNGGFRFSRVPAQAPSTIEVRALGFMPAHRVIEAVDDTTLVFRLEPDPIASRMIERELARLDTRLAAVPYSSIEMDREEIQRYPNWTAREIIQSRVNIGLVGCLIIDEVPIDDRNILNTYMPEEIERIEILRNSLRRSVTARVYTRRFLQRMVAGAIQLRRLPASRIAFCN